MFSSMGDFLNRTWLVWLAVWIAAMIALHIAAPDWSDVAQDGEFSFLPEDSPSRLGDDLFNKAFPHDLLASSIVVVVSRDSGEGLEDRDKQFITDTLRPRLEKIAESGEDPPPKKSKRRTHAAAVPPVISRIHAFDEEIVGSLLVSADNRATLVILELTTDFSSHRNRPAIRAIEGLLDDVRKDDLVPSGLELHLTGSAVVGRDITTAAEQSAASTGIWTVVLVVSLTLLVYRAPLLALIPLVTLFFAMEIALNSLALLADAKLIEVFTGIEAYTTVVVYASGVDYCLFLISRSREELDQGANGSAAIGSAIGKVGGAITASAVTEIVGIGMLVFARFGKFHDAGIAIAFSLGVMLLAVLSLTPALLHLAGRWAFWPNLKAAPSARASQAATDTSATTSGNRFQVLWERIAEIVLRRPGTLWIVSTAVMAPFAVVAVFCYNRLNYDLVGNLPSHAVSVAGTEALQRHFPAGTTGPVNLLIKNDKVDFRSNDGQDAIKALTDRVNDDRDELKIADIRSSSAPLGTTGAGKLPSTGSLARRLFTAGAVRRRAMNYFVSGDPSLGNHVTRLELELTLDPFSEPAMDFLDQLEAGIRSRLPDEIRDSELLFNGSTASLRDLKVVGARDRTLINVLVVASVFVILVILLRKVALTVYLLLTVLFSYLVTLGVTFAVFYLAGREDFSGLD
ncbi:MAG TPA: MMPL family transporter, partial [Planctomycetaceae bacterium]|nr:MMPL family transporter [Planctomycetaceae bacterium]